MLPHYDLILRCFVQIYQIEMKLNTTSSENNSLAENLLESENVLSN